MTFRNECFANATESCFIVASGKLDQRAPERFNALFEQGIDGYQVLLDSPGGSLGAGLRLGRAIRARGMHTVIGRWNDAEPFNEPLNDADCLSACAYAFLGGEVRTILQGNRLGFHQFALPGGDLLQGPGGLTAGQEVSAQLISYLVEMGVDARLFGEATSAPTEAMFYPSQADLEAYDITTPRGFGHFVLEPYGDGIVASSARLDRPRAYDVVTNLTAFCRRETPHLLVTAPEHGLANGEMPLRVGLEMSGADTTPSQSSSSPREIEIAVERARTRVNADAAYVELPLTAAERDAILASDRFVVFFVFPRVIGGSYQAGVEMNDMDRRMLTAAFRFCL
jgi:hypothetical protein